MAGLLVLWLHHDLSASAWPVSVQIVPLNMHIRPDDVGCGQRGKAAKMMRPMNCRPHHWGLHGAQASVDSRVLVVLLLSVPA